MRYKAHVVIEYDTDHNNEHMPNFDPEKDLKMLLSQMDEVGRLNVDYEIISTWLVNTTE